MANRLAVLAVLFLLAWPASLSAQTDQALSDQAVLLQKQAYDLYNRKDYSQAADRFSQLLAIQQEHLGQEHPATLRTQYNLATCLEESGQRARAIALYETVWQAEKKALGPEHSDTVSTLTALAFAYVGASDTAKASAMFAELVEVLGKTQAQDHPDTLTALYNLAQCQIKLEQWDKAVDSCERLAELSARAKNPDEAMTMQAFYMLSACYRKQGNRSKADAAFARYLAIRDKLRDAQPSGQPGPTKLK